VKIRTICVHPCPIEREVRQDEFCGPSSVVCGPSSVVCGLNTNALAPLGTRALDSRGTTPLGSERTLSSHRQRAMAQSVAPITQGLRSGLLAGWRHPVSPVGSGANFGGLPPGGALSRAGGWRRPRLPVGLPPPTPLRRRLWWDQLSECGLTVGWPALCPRMADLSSLTTD